MKHVQNQMVLHRTLEWMTKWDLDTHHVVVALRFKELDDVIMAVHAERNVPMEDIIEVYSEILDIRNGIHKDITTLTTK